MPKAERKKKDTKQRILESACQTFTEKGYRDANITDVCGRAKANRAAVNYYFRDKEELCS